MKVSPLQLKFGTALFDFNSVEQMRIFLGSVCYRDKKGKVWLHHGCNLHDFTELKSEYYKNIPKGVKWQARRKRQFVFGGIPFSKNDEI